MIDHIPVYSECGPQPRRGFPEVTSASDLANIMGGQPRRGSFPTRVGSVDQSVVGILRSGRPTEVSVVEAVSVAAYARRVRCFHPRRATAAATFEREDVDRQCLASPSQLSVALGTSSKRPENTFVCLDGRQAQELRPSVTLRHVEPLSRSGRGRGRTNVARPAHSTPKESRCLD